MGKSFEELRQLYPVFCYEKYSIEDYEDRFEVEFWFRINDLARFAPRWVLKKNADFPRDGQDQVLNQLVFNLGLVELISYWKLTCSPQVVVEAGYLDQEQISWWKKQYFHGLGEFFYTNHIAATEGDFMAIAATPRPVAAGTRPIDSAPCLAYAPAGCLIPIGGGKDSAVSLELLSKYQASNACYIINPRAATIESAQAAGYGDEQIVKAFRTLDPNMLRLNKEGYLNGHTPFSALVAFSAVLAAYLHNKRYVVLSNESSANETTIVGTSVNHQYSKTFQFESDFHNYEKNYIGSGVYYFSLLRPFSELQIARYFAKLPQYHPVFKSCNVGSKTDTWCGKCPKCLFVYIILSPFMAQTELEKIFGTNLLEDPELSPNLEKLIGLQAEKPFECVGTIDEINTALCLTIAKLEGAGEALPQLLQYYRTLDLYSACQNRPDRYLQFFDDHNLVPEEFRADLKKEMLA